MALPEAEGGGDEPTPRKARTEAHREGGQALVEFALAFPIWCVWLLVSIQMALIAVNYYSLMNVTRDSTRWAAIHPDNRDSDILDYARAHSLILTPSQLTLVGTNPSCGALVGGQCASRAPGGLFTATFSYDMRGLVFLPHDFQMGGLHVTIPTKLPDYSVSVMIE
jgi:hypothetical protein